MRRSKTLLIACVVLGLAALGAVLGLTLRRPRTPPHLLLITIDTLRADHLSAWGYARETSPFLDRLAAEGVRFADATVQWPKTGPSFASMLSATYPRDNGIVRRVGIPVPDEFPMLAEELRAQGYATAAVVSNGALGLDFNFQQGFDTYIESWVEEDASGGDGTAAGHVTDLALALARELPRDRPVFLWVHYLDPHFPYVPPPSHRDLFQDDALARSLEGELIPVDRSRRRRDMYAIGRDQMLDDREDLAFYRARYDAEIRYADSQIERLWQGLGETGLLDEAVTFVTADHGESLGEHGYYFDHGRFAYQTCLHVPLIVHAPGRLRPQVVETPVGLIEMAPAMLELAGRELPERRWQQGSSLLRHVDGSTERRRHSGEPEPVYAEAGYALRDNWQKVVRWGRWKLIYAPWENDNRWITERGDRYALFDVQADPEELRELKEQERDLGERMNSVLTAWLQRPRFEVGDDAEGDGTREAADPDAMTDGTRRQLEALGYL